MVFQNKLPKNDILGDGDGGGYQGRYDRWKVICRLLIPSKAAGSVIGKSGSTIKGLREQYGCSVMIPALERGGPERIITIKVSVMQSKFFISLRLLWFLS